MPVGPVRNSQPGLQGSLNGTGTAAAGQSTALGRYLSSARMCEAGTRPQTQRVAVAERPAPSSALHAAPTNSILHTWSSGPNCACHVQRTLQPPASRSTGTAARSLGGIGATPRPPRSALSLRGRQSQLQQGRHQQDCKQDTLPSLQPLRPVAQRHLTGGSFCFYGLIHSEHAAWTCLGCRLCETLVRGRLGVLCHAMPAASQPAPGTLSLSTHSSSNALQVAQAWRGANSPYKHGPPRQAVVGEGVALQPTLHTSHGLFTDMDASGSQSPSSPGGQYTQKHVSDLVAQVRVAAMAALVPGAVCPNVCGRNGGSGVCGCPLELAASH